MSQEITASCNLCQSNSFSLMVVTLNEIVTVSLFQPDFHEHFKMCPVPILCSLSVPLVNTAPIRQPPVLRSQGSSIEYARKIFRKTNISYPLIRTRTCAYQGVRNVSFSENFAYVLNAWALSKLSLLKGDASWITCSGLTSKPFFIITMFTLSIFCPFYLDLMTAGRSNFT